MESRRNVLTLLLCKINPYKVRYGDTDYRELYRSVYSGKNLNKRRKFITYGNFDAVTIYDTGVEEKQDWLKTVEKDRREISEHISKEICYHPIHMISYEQDNNFWQETGAFSVCLITLVYGVMPKNNDPKSCDRYVRDALNHLFPAIDTTKAKFAVYQAINICDAVVIWMTDDINYVLRQTSKLIQNGTARKTYSLLGLSMDRLQDLETYQGYLENRLTEGPFYVRLQGSIRNQHVAQNLFLSEDSKLIEWIAEDKHPNVKRLRVFGNEDFDISLTEITKKQLVCLIINMIKENREISNACWEIHTEFMLPDENSIGSYELSHVSHDLDQCLEDYKKYYIELKKKPVAYPWASAFLELLSTHVNIDHHPILHAPAFLFLKFVQIANYYFMSATSQNGDEHQKQFEAILVKSKERIQQVIRNWSHLTDQLIRTDDLVFHGVGSIPALYETLPEPILEFYHTFLKKVVDMILEVDKNRLDPDKKYEYDFLLVPEQSQRPRISRMFVLHGYHDYVLEHEYACPKDVESCNDVCSENCRRKYLWPEKQVYLVEFQSSLLYDPTSFLFQLVHECFHFFGDSLRMRVVRAKRLADIVTTEILYQLDLEKPWYSDFWKIVRKELEIQRPIGLNLRRTAKQLYLQLNEFLSGQTINKLKEEGNTFYYLKGSEFSAKWLRLQSSYDNEPLTRWERIIDKWRYYFSECYADLMALLLLKIEIVQYLDMVSTEWINSGTMADETDSPESWKFVQRISLVLGCYLLEEQENGYANDELEKTSVFMCLSTWEKSDFVGNNSVNIKMTLRSLFQKDVLPYEKKYNDPPAKLKPILDYLFCVKAAFHKSFEADILNPESSLNVLRNEYDEYFIKGNLFTEAYHNFLYLYHPHMPCR